MHLELVSRQAPKEACVREVVRVSLDLAAVVVPKASDVLAARLRELILSSGLAEGTPLPTERELVAQSGLSRTSVREALRVLETEGLVLTRAGRNGGSQVRRPGRESISRSFELFVRSHGVRFEALLEAREAIEPAAARARRDPPAGCRPGRDDAHPQALDQRHRRRRRACAAQPAYGIAPIMRASRNELLIAFFDAIADRCRPRPKARASIRRTFAAKSCARTGACSPPSRRRMPMRRSAGCSGMSAPTARW